MFEELYDAISFVAAWRWPKADGEVTTADAERIGSALTLGFILPLRTNFRLTVMGLTQAGSHAWKDL